MTNSNVRVLSSLSSAKLREMSDKAVVYTGFLKFQGRVFKQSAAVALEFYTQKPDVQFIANAKQWAAAGYKIKDGGEAIHFTDVNGNRHDLFDFSQVDGNYAPRIWTINAENAGQFKTALGIPQNAPIIKAVIEQTVKKSSVIDCMEALGVPPYMFESFKNTYFGAVQTIIAGRFEIGGNQFNFTPDMSAFRTLSEPQKMHFLTMVSNVARASLMQVEKIANEIESQNIQANNNERGVENAKTNVSTVGKPNGGTAEQGAGGLSAGNPASGIGKQADTVENDSQGRSEVLGNTVRGRGNDGDLSRIQAEEPVGGNSVVQVQPDVGVLQSESDGVRTVGGGIANRELRNEVAELDEGQSPALGRGNADEPQSLDGGESGGREGVGVSGTPRQSVSADEPASERVRGDSGLGANKSVLHGRGGDEGESVSPDNSGLDSIQAKLSSITEEPPLENEGGLSFYQSGMKKRGKKQNPNQLSLLEFSEEREIEIDEELSADDGEPNKLTDDEIITKDLMRGSSFEDGKFRIEAFAKSNPKTEEFAKFLSKEYGIGGSSIDEGFSNHDGKGIKIDIYKNEDGKYRATRSITLSWNQAAKRIAELVQKGVYITDDDIKRRIRNAEYVIRTYNPDNALDLQRIEEAKKILTEYENPEPQTPEKRPYAVGDRVWIQNREFRIESIGEYYSPKDALSEKFGTYGRDISLLDLAAAYPITRSIRQGEFEHALLSDERNNAFSALPDEDENQEPQIAESEVTPANSENTDNTSTTNYIVYSKEHGVDKQYGAIDFAGGRVGVGLVYATLFRNLGRAKAIADEYAKEYPNFDYQVRKAGTSQTVYEVNNSEKPIAENVQTEQNSAYTLYTETKEKYPDHVVLQRLGDFYETYDEDAENVAETLDLTLNTRASHTMCGFPVHKVDEYAETLIAEGFHVVAVDKNGEVTEFDTEYKQDGAEVRQNSEPPTEEETDRHLEQLAKIQENSYARKLYNQFAEMFPQIVNGEHSHERYGFKGDAFEPLSVEHLGGDSYSFMTWYVQEGDLMRDPDFQFTLDHESKLLHIGEYQQDGVYPVGTVYERVYDDNGMVDKKLLAALERNFMQVLKSAQEAGRELTKYTTADGEEITLKEKGDNSDIDNAENAELPEIAYAENPQDKFWDNIAALRELKRIEGALSYNREPYDKYNSKEDSDMRLSRYSGWGGLPEVFDESNTNWSRQRTQLKTILTPDEYEAARETTLNAHYTPQIIIDAMYEAVKNMDLPRNARILEPSCGTGNFISRLPAALSSEGEAEITGVEIDNITARIATHLNPDANILNTGFENSGLDNNDFDLAIGNIPFGGYVLNDPDYTKDWLIHDAFFRKALDKVAPGGIVAFVTSSGTLDKQNPRVREYLAKQADLIGAIRMPNNAFKDAGTKVTADIIFLQKRKTPLLPYQESPSWCYTTPNADSLKINSYFVNNPQMVLGKMEQTTHFDMLTCTPFEGADLKEQLNSAIKNLNAKITVDKREKAAKERIGTIDADGSIKNFTFGKHTDGKFYYREGAKMSERKPTKQLESLCELRITMRELLEKQKTFVPDEALVPLRETLNRQYDDYREKYGVLNSPSTKKVFGDDADFPLLQGLEEFNEETKQYNKADIFSRRTVNAQKEITGAANVEEALQISLDRRGKPDIHYMAELLDSNYPDISTEEVCEKVCAELLEKELCYRDPDRQIPDSPYSGIIEKSEYLSGNVRKKLITAESAMLVQHDPTVGQQYRRNVEALQKVIPEDIKAENIAVRMGVPWIDGEDYTKFLKHLAGRSGYAKNGDVTYSPVTGEFEVSGAKIREKSALNVNESDIYGTSDFSLYALAEKSLNQRQIVVKMEVPHPTEPDKTITRTDSKATKKALEKARIIKEEFKKWIFDDDDRRNKYERKYNNIFNCLVGREYDGSKLTFPGMNSEFKMREHQKNAVARTTLGGNSLIAHVVGAGKSAVIFASVMRKKELGLINKACVVVPKALTEQIAKEWRHLYPDARILTVSNDDLSTEARRKLFTARVATGTYDAVILSREQFEKIPMSRKSRFEFMRKELDMVEDMLRERKRENRGRGDPSTKQLELAKKRMKARIDKLIDPKAAGKAKDDLLEFEQLGFDYLVADEAHAYKNGFVMTKMTNVAGVTTRESGRAADMQMKCDYFNEQLGDGHILLCSGTPVSNSMTELFVMTRYLRPDLLRQAGISRFDDWAATFGNVTTALEQTAYDTYKLKTRFSEFANLPELMAFYKEFADIKSAEKLELPRPNLKNGKNTIVTVPATPEQKAYVKELGERAEAINSGSVHPTVDNFLKITGEARLIGLGNQAVKALYARRGEELPADFVEENMKNGKVDVCAEKVYERWQQSTETKGVQLVFSDIAVNSDNGNFSAYEYIRNELIEKGIPAEQIIFAPKSDSKDREEIFKKINAGEYRVVIASTETLGTGCNIQNKLVALHHVDIPWKPSCLEQREGRILRQGNENPEVEILNYVTESTLDSYLYSTVTNKARFIAQILDNDSPARVCEDMDEKVLTYAEIQAVAAGNPDIKKRIETANALAEFNMLRREWGYERARLRERLETLPPRLEKAKETLSKVQTDCERAKTVADMEELPFENKRLLAEAHRAIANFKKGEKEPISVGSVRGFDVSVKAEEVTTGFSLENIKTETVARITVKGEAEYSAEAGLDESQNNVVRLKNIFAKIIPAREKSAADEVTQLAQNIEQAQSRIDVPFEHEGKLAELTKQLEELDAKLSGVTEQQDVISDPEEEDLVETSEEKSEREQIYSADDSDYQAVPDDDDEPDLPAQSATRKR